MMALSIDVSNGKKKLECLKKQAEEMCIPKTWAGLIHFMALSSVIRCSVFSVYPEASPGIRSLYHGLIHPRQEVTSTDVLYIMFTREGSLDGRTGSRALNQITSVHWLKEIVHHWPRRCFHTMKLIFLLWTKCLIVKL